MIRTAISFLAGNTTDPNYCFARTIGCPLQGCPPPDWGCPTFTFSLYFCPTGLSQFENCSCMDSSVHSSELASSEHLFLNPRARHPMCHSISQVAIGKSLASGGRQRLCLEPVESVLCFQRIRLRAHLDRDRWPDRNIDHFLISRTCVRSYWDADVPRFCFKHLAVHLVEKPNGSADLVS